MKRSLSASSVLPLAFAFLLPAAAPGAVVTTGLIQDLDADVGVTTGGGTVTAWANQAASGGDDVAAGAGGATVVAGPNGGNAIRFNDSTRLIGDDDAAFDTLMDGGGHTWFAVIDAGTNSGAKNRIFGTLQNVNPWTGVAVGTNGSDNTFYTNRPTGSDQNLTGTTSLSSGWMIIAGRLDAGTTTTVPVASFANSATPDATSTVNMTTDSGSGALTIGAEHISGSEYWNGDLARLLIYDRPLSDAEIDQTGLALAQAYNISTSFVPEPSTATTLMLALGAGMFFRRRTKSA